MPSEIYQDLSFYDERLRMFQEFEYDEKKLTEAVEAEDPPLYYYNVPKFAQDKYLNLCNIEMLLDKDSNRILEQYNLDYLKAVKTTTGNGSVFTAVSLCLYGCENYSSMLRYLTALWFLKTKNLRALYPKFTENTSNFDVLKSCVILNHRSYPLTLLAIVNAFHISIGSVYPPHNGLFDPQFLLLNSTMVPMFYDKNSEAITKIHVLWAGSHKRISQDGKRLWVPDRFYPVFDISLQTKEMPPLPVPITSSSTQNNGVQNGSDTPPQDVEPVQVTNKTKKTSPLRPTTKGLRGVNTIYEFLKKYHPEDVCEKPPRNIPRGTEFVLRVKTKNLMAYTHEDFKDGISWDQDRKVMGRYYYLKEGFRQMVLHEKKFHYVLKNKGLKEVYPYPGKKEYLEVICLVNFHATANWTRKITLIKDRQLFGTLCLFQYDDRQS